MTIAFLGRRVVISGSLIGKILASAEASKIARFSGALCYETFTSAPRL
jgi:hypothetical protein